jgi:F0F1-type ATP synthase assembly protein I
MTRRDFSFKLLGVGWFVAICIVGGAAIGLLLDKKVFHTTPALSLVFLTLGTFLALYGVWRMLAPGVQKPKKPGQDKESD